MAHQTHRHLTAAREAAVLISRYDGRAPVVADGAVAARLDEGDTDGALRMDQVRREAEALLADRRRPEKVMIG